MSILGITMLMEVAGSKALAFAGGSWACRLGCLWLRFPLDFLGRGSLADALARRLACGPCV